VVAELEFETSDPAFGGLMRMTTTLSDAEGGTDVVDRHRAGVEQARGPDRAALAHRVAPI
jgi:hypothetical protein